jgi:hypothetical protein
VGGDPNNEFHPVYDQMIDFFMPKKKTKYTMINDTIQEAKLPNEKFDMVFTSPPYFKIEQYQNRGVVTDTNEYDWFENFMKPMITKTCKKLKNGGYMVLVINQLPGDHYIQKMLDYAYSIGLYYLGVISYANTKLKNPQPMWIWQRCNTIPTMLYNPPIVITNHVYKNIKFKVFRDDYLIGGTKQRALVPLLQKINKEKFIYAGPSQGFAQLALAYAGKLTRKKVVLFLGNQTPITKLALTFNSPELHEIHGGYLKKLQEKAEIYNKNNSNSHLVAFGGDEPMFIKLLETNLKKAMPKIKPNRIWLVAGSATVLKVLYKIFPKTKFMVVQVGKTIWPDQIKPERTTLFISNESFMSVAIEQPPYPTVKTYDAKLWTFFKEYGKSGDYIFNIAKDPL